MRAAALAGIAIAIGLAAAAPRAAAEPQFLSRQYARCTNCHYSTGGGGMLTPYGRALSREELSTFGRSPGSQPQGREHEFLYGLLGDATGPVALGIDLRPSHLDVEGQGISMTRDFLMNADISAAVRLSGFTAYVEVGRQPRDDDARVASFEHWISYESTGGLGARVGRFIPAYGVKLADHTSYNRASLQLDNDDQAYALELYFNGTRHLVQVSAGPGRADDVDDPDLRAFAATGRWQFDLRPNVALVASGLYRASSDLAPRTSACGLAVGISPVPRLTLWAQADARFREGVSGDPGYTLLGMIAFEAYRGVWIQVAPQLATAVGDSSAGATRWNLSLNLLPRTHWNIVLTYSHDRDRTTDRSTNTFLAQLHLYL